MSKADWLEQVHRFLTLEWAKAATDGHTFNEFSYLRAIGILEESASKAETVTERFGPRLSDLADALAVRRASASTMLTKLEKEGLVERKHSRLDARAQHIKLTPEGRDAVKNGLSLYEKSASHLLAALGDHQADILALSAGRAAKRARQRSN
ncbi:MarR family winged helix-turn-helix transcriptional regulator [Kordiimonas sp.]|uniref:MarR family winged helix-turn-helix transcriptional regulator n=1 Tax=Kordiimonas sp. TaxID=1970157 RepID=UPI003A938FCA